MNSCTGVGHPAHFARACRNQKTQNATVTAASTTNRAAFALMPLVLTPEPAPRVAIHSVAGQMMSVVMMPPVPVVQPKMQLFVLGSQTWPANLQLQNTCWPQLSMT